MTQTCKKLEDIVIPAGKVSRKYDSKTNLAECRVVDIYLCADSNKPVVYMMFKLMARIEDNIYEAEVGFVIKLNIYDTEHYYNLLETHLHTPGLIWGLSRKTRMPKSKEYTISWDIHENLLAVIERGCSIRGDVV